MKILIVVNVDWFFISHRLVIAKRAIEEGYDVYVAAEDTGRSKEITDLGIKFIDFKFSRSGTNPIREFRVLYNFNKLYKEIRPDIVHHITMKPVIYGSFIAKKHKIKGVVNAIAGLGNYFVSESKGLLPRVLVGLMKYSFKRGNLAVIFQNEDDFEDLNRATVLNIKNMIYFTKGSGVDLKEFEYSGLPENDKINILFPTRMLWDKGVRELKEASDLLKKKYKGKVSFILAGLADSDNKKGVSVEYLEKWSDGNYVNWIGYQKNMPLVYKNCAIVTLPSYYREGIPKSLIEACAIGRPIVTTDSIGCRECVDEGINGFKVAPKEAIVLAEALEKLIVSKELREKFARNSRLKAESEFDVEKVINVHMQIYKKLLDK